MSAALNTPHQTISPILERHRHHTYDKAEKTDEFSSFVAVIFVAFTL